jgi:hypothetical protein
MKQVASRARLTFNGIYGVISQKAVFSVAIQFEVLVC